jgi:hypothetical protein
VAVNIGTVTSVCATSIHTESNDGCLGTRKVQPTQQIIAMSVMSKRCENTANRAPNTQHENKFPTALFIYKKQAGSIPQRMF